MSVIEDFRLIKRTSQDPPVHMAVMAKTKRNLPENASLTVNQQKEFSKKVKDIQEKVSTYYSRSILSKKICPRLKHPSYNPTNLHYRPGSVNWLNRCH